MSIQTQEQSELTDEVEQLAQHAIVVDAWYVQPSFKALKTGDVHSILLQVSADDWERHFKNHKRNQHVRFAMWSAEVEEDIRHETQKAKREKKEKGPHGKLWSELVHRAGFPHCPGVKELIDRAREDEAEEPHDTLRRIFGVESLSFVSPEQIYDQIDTPQVRALVENVARKIAA